MTPDEIKKAGVFFGGDMLVKGLEGEPDDEMWHVFLEGKCIRCIGYENDLIVALLEKYARLGMVPRLIGAMGAWVFDVMQGGEMTDNSAHSTILDALLAALPEAPASAGPEAGK